MCASCLRAACQLVLGNEPHDELSDFIALARWQCRNELRAIADEFEIGVNAVVGHLGRLRAKGAIEWIRDGRAAGVRLAGKRCCKCGGTGVFS